MSILHTSDLHLDHVLTEYRRDVRAVRRRELVDTFNFIVSEAIRLNVRLVLIPGDLICADSVADSVVEEVRNGFARLGRSSIFVAVTPGEAEESGGLELLREACSGENVHLFMAEEWSSVSPFPGVTVWGLRTTSRNSTMPVLSNLVVEGSGMHVGLMHGTFAGTPGLDSSICPISPDALSQSGLDYLALGHYHNMVNCSVGKATCWYSGSPVHLNFDTRGERHALLVSLREDGTRVNPMKVPSRQHRVITVDIAGKSGAEIRERLSDMANAELCLRVELEGRVDPALRPILAGLAREFEDRFFHLEVADRTELVVRGPKGEDRRRPGRGSTRKEVRLPRTDQPAGKNYHANCTGMDALERDLLEAEQTFTAKMVALLTQSEEANAAAPGSFAGQKDSPESSFKARRPESEGSGDRSHVDNPYGVERWKEVVDCALALGLSALGEVFRGDDREAVGCGEKRRPDD